MATTNWTRRSGIKTVSLADLAVVGVDCPELNPAKVDAVRASGVGYAPIVVYAFSCGTVKLVDGRHRLHVAKEIGVETLCVEVVKIRGRALCRFIASRGVYARSGPGISMRRRAPCQQVCGIALPRG